MLEDDARIRALAEGVPNRFAKRARAFRPLAVRLEVLGVRHHAPVIELTAVDDPDRTVLHAERPLAFVGHHRNGAPALRARDLERHAAQAARASPDEDDIV